MFLLLEDMPNIFQSMLFHLGLIFIQRDKTFYLYVTLCNYTYNTYTPVHVHREKRRSHACGRFPAHITCPQCFVLPHLKVPVRAHVLHGWSPLSVILLGPASEGRTSLSFTHIPRGSSSHRQVDDDLAGVGLSGHGAFPAAISTTVVAVSRSDCVSIFTPIFAIFLLAIPSCISGLPPGIPLLCLRCIPQNVL